MLRNVNESVYFAYVTYIVTTAGFGFVEFEDKRDAEDAIRDLDGTVGLQIIAIFISFIGSSLLGSRIVVEWARGGRAGKLLTFICYFPYNFALVGD